MDRAELAARWAGQLTQMVYVAQSRDEIEHELSDLLDDVLGAVRAEDVDTAAVEETGGRLAEIGFTKAVCVGYTVELLGTWLPRLPGLADVAEAPARLLSVLGALATGFTNGVRNRLFAEQEDIKRALTHAKENAERDLQASEELFKEIFTSSSVGMALSDLDGTLVRTNRALATILEYPPRELGELNLHDLFHPTESQYIALRYQELLEKDALPFRERRKLRRRNGDEALAYLSGVLIRHPDGTPRHFVTSVEDISDKHLLEDRLHFQSVHDPLTMLINRQRFLSKIEEALAGKRAAESITIFHLNLDGFAAVNDGPGRDAGDQLLRVVAQRLQQVVADESATVARLDGDEFGIMIETSPSTPNPDAIAQRINEELGEPHYVGDQGLAASASIAVLENPRRDANPNQLLQATDIALRRLKSSGRRQWAVVDPQQGQLDRERYSLAASIPGAWENGEIGLEYQPLVAIADRRVVAVQPLLRWSHSLHGTLDHERVVAALEETGLNLPIGRWLLRQACEQVMSWTGRVATKMPLLYVELTRAQAADPDLVATVKAVLAATGLPNESLRLGMPVQALCMLDGLAEDNLDILVDLGIATVLYDFGTTRGDLACLEDLPVRAVKMTDRVVRRVSRAVKDGRETLFVRATRDLVPLVRDTGAGIVVSGVETVEELAWWQEIGAETASGPLLGAPGPAQDIEQLFP